MDIKRVEKFLQAMMPENAEAHAAVKTAFECMAAHPISAVPSIGMMIGRLQQRLYSLSGIEAANACSNVLTGVMIAWATENDELCKHLIDNYLEGMKRVRGEHVIDFWQKKSERH